MADQEKPCGCGLGVVDFLEYLWRADLAIRRNEGITAKESLESADWAIYEVERRCGLEIVTTRERIKQAEESVEKADFISAKQEVMKVFSSLGSELYRCVTGMR